MTLQPVDGSSANEERARSGCPVAPLRVVFITQEDPFYIAEFFRTFFRIRKADEHVQFAGAFILDTLGQRDHVGLAKRMYNLYGGVGFARLAARYAVKKAAIAARDRIGLLQPSSVEQILMAANVPTRRVADINAPESLAALRACDADVFLSISATQKFSPDVLRIARRGCFNSHSGDLPRFRGMMPTFWTLYENETHATVTIHKMAEVIDAGEIWRQGRVPIAPDDSLDDVIRETKRLSARLMSELLAALLQGDVVLTTNDPSKKSYYKFPTAEQSAELRRRGRKLL